MLTLVSRDIGRVFQLKVGGCLRWRAVQGTVGNTTNRTYVKQATQFAEFF